MQPRLLDLLRCADCRRNALEPVAYRAAADGAIEEGELRCRQCGARFPVINGIPRMLPAPLRAALARFHPAFFARHPELVPAGAGAVDDGVRRTLEGFSYQHVKLNRAHFEPERWRQNFTSSLPVPPDFFAGARGLDLGCGEGRHAYWAHAFGAEVVGVDLSEGVEVARQVLADCPRAHVVQGDVYHLPVRPAAFDFAYSLGVLHHLPDPEGGFRHLVSAVRPGGRVFIWVYGLEDMRLWYRISHLRWLRGVTPRLPRGVQLALSVAIAVLLELFLWVPARAVSRLPGGPAVAARLPLADACRRPFVAKVRSVFDRLHPPFTHYHTADELAGWFRRAGLDRVEVVNRDGRGWAASGVRRAAGGLEPARTAAPAAAGPDRHSMTGSAREV